MSVNQVAIVLLAFLILQNVMNVSLLIFYMDMTVFNMTLNVEENALLGFHNIMIKVLKSVIEEIVILL